MRRNAPFWRNLALVGIVHVAVLLGLSRWSGKAQKLSASEIVWIDAGAMTSISPVAPAEVEEPVTTEENDIAPVVPAAPPESAASSDIVLPETTPTPTPAPTPGPSPPAKPAPTARPAKKAKAAKAPPTPRAKATPRKAVSLKRVPTKADPPGNRAAGGGASSGAAAASGNASEAATYANVLHDRFFSAWEQPTSVVATGAKMSTLVRVRIERDGRVSNFAVVRPSGNVVVDESVAAVGKRVTQVEAPPAGLGSTGHYDVNINFELNAE